jgi:hypothetical protein
MGYIPTVRFRDNNLNTIFTGLEMDQVKSVVYEKFIPNIEQAIKKNKKDCIFCYVGDDYQVIINKQDYKSVLNILEEYYLSKENYEVCTKIKNIKDAIG